MMKKLIPILTAILVAFMSYGQAPAPYPILVDSQRDTVAGLQVFQANQITFRASYRSGNATNNLVAVTPFMYWQPYGPTNATVVTGRWTIVSASSGTVDFAFTPSDLNFATGTYTYQIGLNVSGGPNVIKQGSFIIKASQASIGASPIAFATTNVNWGAINWSGLPAYEYQTNTIAVSNALHGQIISVSNALNTRVTATETGKVAKAGDTMNGNLGFTNAGLTSLDVIDWDLAPTSTIQQGRLQWEAARDTLRLGLGANVSLDVGQQLMLYAKGIETNTINKGEVVYVAGAAGDNPTVKRASNASEALSARTIGIAAENIASNNNGFVVNRGTIFNLNTTNFNQGSLLYLGANGTLQTNLPDAPLHGVFIGVVERVGQNNGQIYVAVQNYQELRELSDVFINGLANNDLLAYNSASNRWQNTTLTALGITSGLLTNEVDPIFVAASNSFYPRSNPSNFITTAALSGYATTSTAVMVSGSTMTGTLTIANIVGKSALTIKAGDQTTSTADLSLSGGLGTLIGATGNVITTSNLRPDGGIKAKTATDLTLTAGDGQGSPFNQNSGNLVLSAGTGGPNTEGTIIANSAVTMTDGLTITNGDIFMMGSGAYGLKLRPDANTADGNSKRIYLTSRNGGQENTAEIYKRKEDHALVYYWNGQERDVFVGNGFENDGQYRLSGQIDLLGSIRLVDSNSFTVGSITATGGVKVGQNSFQADLAGNISQDATNTASLGVVSATSLSGNHIGNAANLTNFPASLATTSDISTLQGYTNRAASALASSVWASANSTTNFASAIAFTSFTSTYATADATTNYQSRLQFVASSNAINTRLTSVEGYTNRAALAATTNFVTNALAAYLPLAGGTMEDHIFMNGFSLYSVTIVGSGTSGTNIDFDAAEVNGSWTFTEQPTIPGYLTTSTYYQADSTTNYTSRITFNSTSNGFNTRITAVEGYTNRAASALSSSVWASADSTTNYASRITFNATSNSFNSRISNVATGAVYVTNLSAISGSGLIVVSNQIVNTNVGYVTTNTLTNYLALTGGTLSGSLSVGTNAINFSSNIVMQFVSGGLDITATVVRSSVFSGSFTGNGANITNLQSGSLPNLSGTYLLLSSYLNDTNRLQIQSGSVTQGQAGTFGTSYISSTNYWISLGSTNWVKFEGKLNTF